jgi:hypothetical protein
MLALIWLVSEVYKASLCMKVLYVVSRDVHYSFLDIQVDCSELLIYIRVAVYLFYSTDLCHYSISLQPGL